MSRSGSDSSDDDIPNFYKLPDKPPQPSNPYGNQLLKLMQQRGFELTKEELQQCREKKQDASKKKSPGYFEGGVSADLQTLMRGLNKALINNDKPQASAILNFVIEKDLHPQDRFKFGKMKCKLALQLGAYSDAISKAEFLLAKTQNQLQRTSYFCMISQARLESGKVWEGYYDFLRAKSTCLRKRMEKEKTLTEQGRYGESEGDIILKQLQLIQLQYNAKMQNQAYNKQVINMVIPSFVQFRHRVVKTVSCGYYHALFLVTGVFDNPEFKHQSLFAVGQNGQGQITGFPTPGQSFSSPHLIHQLQGKNICGILAVRECSMAYDKSGIIYEWGGAGMRAIEPLINLKREILSLSRGEKHYAALTSSGGVFWGTMKAGTLNIDYEQPTKIDVDKIKQISSGNRTIYVINQSGELFVFGSNQFGQCGVDIGKGLVNSFIKVQLFSKALRAFPIQDSVFIKTEDQVFFSGRISFKRECVRRFRPAQFSEEIQVISISGANQTFLCTDSQGRLFEWIVSETGKFKRVSKLKDKAVRGVHSGKNLQFFYRTLIEPKLSVFQLKTPRAQLKTYQPIKLQVKVHDQYGQNRLPVFYPVHYQVCLTKDLISKDDLLEAYDQLPKGSLSKDSGLHVREIHSICMNDLQISFQQGRHQIEFTLNASGVYYFYLLQDGVPIEPLLLKMQVSKSEHQQRLKQQKQKDLRERQSALKAKQEQQRLRKQQEQRELEQQWRKREETQRRAEQALKRQIIQNQEKKKKEQDQRKMKKQLLTGGGYDLRKLQMKKQQDQEEDLASTKKEFKKTGQLPAIRKFKPLSLPKKR